MARIRNSRTSSGGFSTAIEPSGKCKRYGTYVLVGTNSVLMFFSVAFLGIGIYRVTLCSLLDPLSAECDVTSTLDGGLFRHFSNIGTVALVVAGAFLMLVSCLGFIAVWCKSKILMAVYAGLVMILIIALGSSGVLLLAYGGVIPNDTIARFVTDLQGSIFDECCFEAGFVDEGAPLCEDVKNVTDICLDQEVDIDDSICDFLETLEVEDVDGFPVPLVGNTTLGGCGGDDGFEGFVEQFLALTINDVLIGFAAAELVCVGIFLCTFVAAWVLLCSKKDTPAPAPTTIEARVASGFQYTGKPLPGKNGTEYI